MRTPQLLINYPVAYDNAVEAAWKMGKWGHTFDTPTQAQSAKFKFYRFFKSACFYKPDSELAKMCAGLEVRISGSTLELVQKASDPVVQQIQAATQKTLEGNAPTIDRVAQSMEFADKEMEELRKMIAEGKLPGSI
jgi:hypothetical protein